LIEILLGMAAVAGCIWLYLKFLGSIEEKAGLDRSSGWFEFQKRRNRIQTLLPSEQKRTDEPL